MAPRIAVVYYSSTAHVYDLAVALADGATQAGAEVRLRRAAELAPMDAISENEEWLAHYEATKGEVPEAQLDDLEWAQGFAFGTPARYGLPAAQLKQFLDQLAPLWLAGKLKDKTATAFTTSQREHGGQESTLLAMSQMFFHWGAIIIPPDTLADDAADTGANPYGTSFPTGEDPQPVSEPYLEAARRQGARLVDFTGRVSG